MAQDHSQDAQLAPKKSYKDTLNLPRTDFPMRPKRGIEDEEMLKRWADEDLCTKTFYHNEGKEKFILHMGPPYANGPIHIGHAYTTVLKDIIAKSERMSGKQAPVTPGWDCHGLPIEIKVAKEHGKLDRTEFIKACRTYAAHWVDVQRDQLKALGILMDWDRPYITMNPVYEHYTLKAFGQLVGKGYIQKKLKTVPWCGSCQTVLATAEIEYADRKDPSTFILFPLVQESVDKFFPQFAGEEISMLAWTTTPWTIPLNRALFLKPDTEYAVLENDGKKFIMGASLADKFCQTAGIDKKVVATINSADLLGARVHNPVVSEVTVPVLLDGFVSTDDGTAVVHSAPGCGPEDYEVGIKNGLEIYSPLGPDATYTKGILPTELEGMPIVEGNIWVIKNLAASGRLLFKNSIRHPYPHCWRCHNGLIFRATSQWFCNLTHNDLKGKTTSSLKDIWFIPSFVEDTLDTMIEGRLEWCLSRQRTWGVPITALLCSGCNEAYISRELIDKVAVGVEKEGIEYWAHVPIEELVGPDFACSHCKGTAWTKEQDILDVWFDSGISHYAVLQHRDQLRFPADCYLEGKDQTRGWFQSSLLTSHIIEDAACTKSIVTHGFVVDGKGQKMSKSRGNVIAPEEVTKKFGIDGLRLWASSNDFESDAVISDDLLGNVERVFRKIRNTGRFLLSNLYDFDMDRDGVAVEEMSFIDRYALSQLCVTAESIRAAYAQRKLTSVFHQLGDYTAVELSALYLDIIKDRLYVAESTGHDRRSAQTACWYILDTLTKLMAPVLSFTAEQLSDHYQTDKTESIHLQDFADTRELWKRVTHNWSGVAGLSLDKMLPRSEHTGAERIELDRQWKNHWSQLFDVRNAALRAIEVRRQQGHIKHPLEGRLTLSLDATELKALRDQLASVPSQEAFFKELLVVSQCTVQDDGFDPTDFYLPGLHLRVERALGTKCPRCWMYIEEKGEDELCNRCTGIAK